MSYCPEEESPWLTRSVTTTTTARRFTASARKIGPIARLQRPPTKAIYCPSATLIYKDLLGFLMSYCPEDDELWFVRNERLKLGNFYIIVFTGIFIVTII
jgi:hypothetical protein